MKVLAPAREARREAWAREMPFPKYDFFFLHFTPTLTNFAFPFENLSTSKLFAYFLVILEIETFLGELIPSLSFYLFFVNQSGLIFSR